MGKNDFLHLHSKNNLPLLKCSPSLTSPVIGKTLCFYLSCWHQMSGAETFSSVTCVKKTFWPYFNFWGPSTPGALRLCWVAVPAQTHLALTSRQNGSSPVWPVHIPTLWCCALKKCTAAWVTTSRPIEVYAM